MFDKQIRRHALVCCFKMTDTGEESYHRKEHKGIMLFKHGGGGGHVDLVCHGDLGRGRVKGEGVEGEKGEVGRGREWKGRRAGAGASLESLVSQPQGKQMRSVLLSFLLVPCPSLPLPA